MVAKGMAAFPYGERHFLGHGGDVLGSHSRVIYNPDDGTAIRGSSQQLTQKQQTADRVTCGIQRTVHASPGRNEQAIEYGIGLHQAAHIPCRESTGFDHTVTQHMQTLMVTAGPDTADGTLDAVHWPFDVLQEPCAIKQHCTGDARHPVEALGAVHDAFKAGGINARHSEASIGNST